MNALRYMMQNLVGPASVMAAGSMGAGAVATLILAGAWFRYELLWVLLFMLPLFVISVDTSSRIGAVNQGEGMLSLIRRHLHPGVAWLLLVINVPVHLLVAMGQFSIMTSALLSLLGFDPPSAVAAAPTAYSANYLWMEIAASITLAVLILWVFLAQGYSRMQNAMTAFLILMFLCFLAIALRSFSEAAAIFAGFVPGIPDDLPVPGRDTQRLAGSTIIAMVGAAIAPGALLGIPYLSSDARKGALDLRGDLRKSVLNLGVIFGAYAMFILIAGGYALYPLANHAEIDSVHQAGQVMSGVFPGRLASMGPVVFSLGLFLAAITTLVVAVQVIIYISLDMLRKPWANTPDNVLFRRTLTIVVVMAAVLAPLWSFPAMLKVLLLMGVNLLVIPLVMVALLVLVNRRTVMGADTASRWRNATLLLCFVVSLALAVDKGPALLSMISAG
jgi:manganese transport protein